jgi:peroxiredoxin 2/4
MPMIGQVAPAFTAKAVFDGGVVKDISLEAHRGKWTVLFFYQLDFTLVCPTEILQFHELLPLFKDLETEVIGCSVDSVHSHKRWIKDDLGELNYPLIGDFTKSIARDYCVLIEKDGFATRGTFIIDPEGKVQYMGIHNTAVGRDVHEILRVLTALKSGELCGAGWKPGDTFIQRV